MSVDLKGIITWLKGWFYDKSEVNTIANSKLNANLTTANKNLVTNGSGDVVLEDKPVIPDISGKIDTAGTGLSKSGTTLNHSNSITAQSSTVFKKIKYDGQGHITGTANVDASDLPSHNHSISNVTDLQTNLDNKVDKVTGKGLSTNDYTTAEKNKLANIEAEANKYVHPSTHSSDIITESSALSNIGTSANATQHTINTAINTKIGDLSSIKAIEVVSTLPTASSSTMNRLYIVSEDNKINVYYTEQNGSSYAWHKMDTDILDELSIDWSDIQNNPFSSSTPSSFANASHNHDDLYYTFRDIDSFLNGKANTSHSHNASDISITDEFIIEDWGVSNQEDFDSLAYNGITTLQHNLQNKINTSDIANNLTTTSAGKVLDARQGKALADRIGDCITSIELVPKSDDTTGAIRLYYGDEPTNNS